MKSLGKVKEVLAGTYEFGNKPGQYSKEAFQELEKSYNNAKQAFENVGVRESKSFKRITN